MRNRFLKIRQRRRHVERPETLGSSRPYATMTHEEYLNEISFLLDVLGVPKIKPYMVVEIRLKKVA